MYACMYIYIYKRKQIYTYMYVYMYNYDTQMCISIFYLSSGVWSTVKKLVALAEKLSAKHAAERAANSPV